MPPPPHPLRQKMRDMYQDGMKRCDIADQLGVSRYIVTHYTRDIPRARPYSSATYLIDRALTVPVGNLPIKTALTIDQLKTLEANAKQWGCETLAEAALEIIRDALEEVS